MAELLPGFESRIVEGEGARIHLWLAGRGPALLLLHGFPQTGLMWQPVARRLAENFRVVIAELRGYGRSSCPPTDPGHHAFSKRAMAADMVAVMERLGHRRFLLAGHDRGGRVAYRLALDHPERVVALAVLDIVPTLTMWEQMDIKLAMKAYHWLLLAQPHPLPEMLIGHDPAGFLDYTMASWTKAGNLSVFDPAALADYRACFSQPERLHAACNDYRAGQTADLAADRIDRDAGRRIVAPLLALWGTGGFPSETGTPLETWRQWCSGAVEGEGVDAGHFIVEENPAATIAALEPFLMRHTGQS
jgi:haloacetate dehalogenase